MKQFSKTIHQISYILNRQQKLLGVLVFILTCIGSLLECIGVSAIIPVVNIVLKPEFIKNIRFVRESSFLNSLSSSQMALLIILIVIALYIFKNIFFIFLSWVRIKFSCKMQREVAVNVMKSYMGRGYQFFLKKNYGELHRGIAEDNLSIYAILYMGFRLISDILTIILLCAFMVITDFTLSITMMFVSVLCVLIIYTIFKKRMFRAGEEYRKYTAKTEQAILQAFQGIKDVLVLRKQKYFIKEYEDNLNQVQKMRCIQTVGQESPAYIIEAVCITGLMIMVACKVAVNGDNSIDFVADLAAFAVAAFRILPSLGRISISLNHVITNMPGIDAVYQNIKEAEQFEKEHPEMVFETSERVSVKASNQDIKCEQRAVFEKELLIKDITFAYSSETGNVLENINLKVEKGQSIAFIGTSGAGKSTLVDILLGLLHPQKGNVYVDGKAIVDNLDVWSQLIAYVPQTVFLSDESIKKNIAFGENESEIDIDKVWDCLNKAELTEFVESLASGIETQVGDRGVRLSGGQRQRIAIARALYHQPQIMVLDEATSALDNDTEKAIMSAIEMLQGQVTLIIIAHRLTTVRNCDVIYEVSNRNVKIKRKDDIFTS